MVKYFAGIDVQVKRGCSYYIINAENRYVISGWIKSNEIKLFKDIFTALVKNKFDEIAIGIDAPRMPLKNLRFRYYDRNNKKWLEKEKLSVGRECEVIINSYRLANCQWTKTFENSPRWMKLGFRIFDTLKEFNHVYEIFPTASYKMLENENVKYELCLNYFKDGVKDMLDSSVGAFTVKEFIEGKGMEVGGEDNLGTIVLPRKIKDL